MNQEQMWSVVRSVLKLLAGGAIAKGWGDSSLWEGVIGAVIGLAAMAWSHWTHGGGVGGVPGQGTVPPGGAS